nr:MAG TPA: hypothetical protein [Caudoviricetes sp.]
MSVETRIPRIPIQPIILLFDKLHKFCTGGTFVESTSQLGSDSITVVILYTTGANAQMLRLNDDGHTRRTEDIRQCQIDLLSKTLLYLRTAREEFHHTIHLGETQNSTVRNIRNRSFAEDRNEVMLAVGSNLNVSLHYHRIISHLVRNSGALGEILVVESPKDFPHEHLGDTSRCFMEGIIRESQTECQHDMRKVSLDHFNFLLVGKLGFDTGGFDTSFGKKFADFYAQLFVGFVTVKSHS